jgi:hypothetical protein
MTCSRTHPPLKILVLESENRHFRLGTVPASVLCSPRLEGLSRSIWWLVPPAHSQSQCWAGCLSCSDIPRIGAPLPFASTGCPLAKPSVRFMTAADAMEAERKAMKRVWNFIAAELKTRQRSANEQQQIRESNVPVSSLSRNRSLYLVPADFPHTFRNRRPRIDYTAARMSTSRITTCRGCKALSTTYLPRMHRPLRSTKPLINKRNPPLQYHHLFCQRISGSDGLVHRQRKS